MIDHQLLLKSEWNTRRNFLSRARHISNVWRSHYNMPTLDELSDRINYNGDNSMPIEFQGTLYQAHLFNKYLKELRERYL